MWTWLRSEKERNKRFGDLKGRAELWTRVDDAAQSVFPEPADRAWVLEQLGFLNRLRLRAAMERSGLLPAPRAPEPTQEGLETFATAWMRDNPRRPAPKSARRTARRHLTEPPTTINQKMIVEWTAWLVASEKGDLPGYSRGRRPSGNGSVGQDQYVEDVAEYDRRVDREEARSHLSGKGLAFLQAVLTWAIYPKRPVGAEQIVNWLKTLRRQLRKPREFRGNPEHLDVPPLQTFEWPIRPETFEAFVGGRAALREASMDLATLKQLCPSPQPSGGSLVSLGDEQERAAVEQEVRLFLARLPDLCAVLRAIIVSKECMEG